MLKNGEKLTKWLRHLTVAIFPKMTHLKNPWFLVKKWWFWTTAFNSSFTPKLRVFTVKSHFFYKKNGFLRESYKKVRGPPYNATFWPFLEPVYRGQKSCFTLFWPPKWKIFKILSKIDKNWEIDYGVLRYENSQNLGQILVKFCYCKTP